MKQRSDIKGITLIALIITIIVLLILAGITIGALTSNNSVLKQAGIAKTNTQIAEEEEIVKISAAQSIMMNLKDGIITEENLEKSMKENTNRDFSITDTGDSFEILYKDTNRFYEVSNDGEIISEGISEKDDSIANFEVDNEGNISDGSEGKPYLISSIEDLVALANIVNGKGNYFDRNKNIITITSQNTYKYKYFKLTRNLNFKSSQSYADLNVKWRYNETDKCYLIDENSETNLKEIITDTNGVGWISIAPDTGSGHLGFGANIFDGQGYSIDNIYYNNSPSAFFGTMQLHSVVKNLTLSGEAKSLSSYAFARRNGTYINCTNKIDNCLGYTNSSGSFINCSNYGIVGNSTATQAAAFLNWSGISSSDKIINCYNNGKVITKAANATDTVGGIFLDHAYSTGYRTISNCINNAEVLSRKHTFFRFYGSDGSDGGVTLTNCFYRKSKLTYQDDQYINAGSIDIDTQTQSVVLNALNQYVNEHKDDYKTNYGIQLYNWKIDSNGNFVFDI